MSAQKQVDIPIATYLRVICSEDNNLGSRSHEDNDASSRGCELLLYHALEFSSLVVPHILELKLAILSLCHSNRVRWGTISNLILILSSVIQLELKSCYSLIPELLELCRVISQRFTRSSFSTHPQVCLYPLVEAIGKLVQSRPLDLKLMYTLVEYSVDSFSPHGSLAPVLSPSADQFVAEILKCDISHYAPLATPISSLRSSVSRLFALIWSRVVAQLLNRPPLMSALWPHSEAFVLFAGGTEEPLAAASKFVIDCLKSSLPDELKEFASIGADLIPLLTKALKTPKPATSEEEEAEEEEIKEEPAPPAAAEEAPAPKPEPDGSMITAKVELTLLGKTKKKPMSCQVRLLPDAEILTWAAGADIAEGDALDLGDVAEVTEGPPRQYKLTVTTQKSGMTLQLVFEDEQTAATWKTAIFKLRAKALAQPNS